MGVGPPGRTGRDQLAFLRTDVLPRLVDHVDVPVIAVCCEQAPPSHVDAIRERGAFVAKVTCAGNLHTSVIEKFIREGAPGVIVCTCPTRDCVSREGPKWLRERMFHDREAELHVRVNPKRVRIATLAPGDLRGSLTAFDEFVRDLALLHKPAPHEEPETEPICDPQPLTEGAS